MKKYLALLAGVVFVLAWGTVYAEEMMPANKDSSDNLILDQDILKYNQDQNQNTINPMPAEPGAGGSAAGGTGGPGSDQKGKTYEKPAQAPVDPLEKNLNFNEPYDNGRSGKDPYKPMENYDGDTYRY